MISTIFLGNKNLRLLLKEIEYFWFNNSRSKRTEDIRNKKIENSVNIWKKGNSINPLGIPKKKSRTEKITDKIIKKLKNTIKEEDTRDVNKISFPCIFSFELNFNPYFMNEKFTAVKRKRNNPNEGRERK